MGGTRESMEKLVYFRREVERILKEFFDTASGAIGDPEVSLNVPLDILETAEELRIVAELPGFEKGSIRLEVMRDTLTISGAKPAEQSPARSSRIVSERVYGRYSRTLELPAACDTRKADASYSKGVLTIVLPKIDERRGGKRSVEIRWEENPA